MKEYFVEIHSLRGLLQCNLETAMHIIFIVFFTGTLAILHKQPSESKNFPPYMLEKMEGGNTKHVNLNIVKAESERP